MCKKAPMLCRGVVKTNRSIIGSTDAPPVGVGGASGQAGQVQHPTKAERSSRGKAERKLVLRAGEPRSRGRARYRPRTHPWRPCGGCTDCRHTVGRIRYLKDRRGPRCRDRDRRVRGARRGGRERRGRECGNGSWLVRLEVLPRLDGLGRGNRSGCRRCLCAGRDTAFADLFVMRCQWGSGGRSD